MISTEAKIIEIGNSEGVRLRQSYLKSRGLKKGDTVEVTVKKAKTNNKKVAAAMREAAKLNGVLANLDVKKWEAERDREWAEREKEFRDILRR